MDPKTLKTTRFPVNHKVKCHPEPFREMWAGRKGHEIRFNDRGYQVAHSVRESEWDPVTGRYSGRSIDIIITHLRYAEGQGFPSSAGLKPGYVVFDFLIVNHFAHDGATNAAANELFEKEGL